MNAYIERVLADTRARCANEPEFLQTVEEVLASLDPVVSRHPEYERAALLERMVEPERVIEFRVVWQDDAGRVQVNRGYRVQFNSAIGPYKGGLRFHPSVNLSIMKFLAFEQVFKNSLTTLPIGGAKGGADFDPRGRSEAEVMRFCQAFMTELYRHIGPDVDVPAGDLGVGSREIGYLFGQYKRIRNAYENGVLTGKGLSYGGSLIRPEATGYGAVYYAGEVLHHEHDTLEGKTFALSGFGNVAWGAVRKITDLGGKVITLSGPDGFILDEAGVNTQEKLDFMLEMRDSRRDRVQDYADRFGVPFFAGEKPWGVKADVLMPCATQNEVDLADARRIAANGVKYYIEVSNMPTTADAMAFLTAQKGMIIAPSKAVNAGGVATSALEMCQNSMRYSWTAAEVETRLRSIMVNIHDASAAAAEENGLGYNLVAGANIAGFSKVAEAMLAEGLVRGGHARLIPPVPARGCSCSRLLPPHLSFDFRPALPSAQPTPVRASLPRRFLRFRAALFPAAARCIRPCSCAGGRVAPFFRLSPRTPRAFLALRPPRARPVRPPRTPGTSVPPRTPGASVPLLAAVRFGSHSAVQSLPIFFHRPAGKRTRKANLIRTYVRIRF